MRETETSENDDVDTDVHFLIGSHQQMCPSLIGHVHVTFHHHLYPSTLIPGINSTWTTNQKMIFCAGSSCPVKVSMLSATTAYLWRNLCSCFFHHHCFSSVEFSWPTLHFSFKSQFKSQSELACLDRDRFWFKKTLFYSEYLAVKM